MLADENLAIRTLHERLAQRVVGQDDALTLIANRIKSYRAGLTDPEKPVGVFLLLGPSGVGKTETAYALADALYGGERNLVAINLSEYQEAHTISQLKGAPPGYVGYGTGGVLTEAVRRKPYCVVLLDEFEKAHPDVLEAFYNVFDKGVMEDGTGLQVDFRNTVILATSNAASELITDACTANATNAPPDSKTLVDRLHPVLVRLFKPALLARMAITPYRPLGIEQVRRIVEIKLAKLEKRALVADPDFPGFDAATVDWVMQRLSTSGAREVERVIMDELVVGMVDDMLDRQFIQS
jgi:type VI secretion system protein VasG